MQKTIIFLIFLFASPTLWSQTSSGSLVIQLQQTVLFLLLSAGLLFWLYFKRKADSANVLKQLNEPKKYPSQAEVLRNRTDTICELPVSVAGGADPDHSFVLNLADEITLTERNISLMLIDRNIKSLKRLNRSIGKLKDDLAANGYEIPELLGKPYNEELKAVITNTIRDENLEKGIVLITKIVKPQVNFNDKMIQAAQIEIRVGDKKSAGTML
ncbi:MAG: hypothetical protein LBH77_04040 [Tannerella sp.]|nr:hypothetical protein [Tannerella sp.]